MIGFIVGLIIGSIVGVAFTALCSAASKADVELENMIKNRQTDGNRK